MCLRYVALLVAIAVVFAHQVQARQDVPALPDVPHIVVVGTGAAEAEPDFIELTISVLQARPESEEATTAVEERLLAIVNAILGLGVEEDQISVNALELSVAYDYREDPPKPVQVEAERSIDVTLRDLGMFDTVVKAAVSGGATGISRPRLRSNVEQELAKQAQSRAILQAMERAEAIARGFGHSLGSVYGIASSGARDWRWRSGFRGGGLFGAPAMDADRSELTSLTFTPRPVERQTQVYVVFLIGPPLDVDEN